MKKKIGLYTSCETLPIYNFTMFLSEGDYKYLADGKVNKAFVSKRVKKLKKLGEKIMEEYRRVTFNTKDFKQEKEKFNLLYITSKFETTSKILTIYYETFDLSVLSLLNELGYQFNEEKEVEPQIEVIVKALKVLKNKINIATINFKKKYNIDATTTEIEGTIFSRLDKQALILETSLELGYRIDIKKTSVIRWENLLKANKEKAESINNIRDAKN